MTKPTPTSYELIEYRKNVQRCFNLLSQEQLHPHPNLHPQYVQIWYEEAIKNAKKSVHIYTDNLAKNLLTDRIFSALEKMRTQRPWVQLHIVTRSQKVPPELASRFNQIKKTAHSVKMLSKGFEEAHEALLVDNCCTHYEATLWGNRTSITSQRPEHIVTIQNFFKKLNRDVCNLLRHPQTLPISQQKNIPHDR